MVIVVVFVINDFLFYTIRAQGFCVTMQGQSTSLVLIKLSVCGSLTGYDRLCN